MAVALARVDDRLIHGQIVEGWVPYLRADAIVVVGDDVCRDEERCRLMRLNIPPRLRFGAISISALPDYLAGAPSERTLVLFGSIADALAVVAAGVPLTHLNVGNLHHAKGGTRVTPSVFLDAEDRRLIRELLARGVRVEAKEVPEGRCCGLEEFVAQVEGAP